MPTDRFAKWLMVIMAVSVSAATAAEPVGKKSDSPPAKKGKNLPANTWVAVRPALKLPENLKGARWATGDGYSTNVYRSKTGTMILRTGVHYREAGLTPGYYSNALVEWNLKTNRGRAIDVCSWGGGSYGGGKLLPVFKAHPSPTPRHTYDSLVYVGSEDALYLMGSSSYRMFGKDTDKEAKSASALDFKSTWKYSFADRGWTRIDGNVWQLREVRKCPPVESHTIWWPEGNRLLFLDCYGSNYAEFDLKTRKWKKVAQKNRSPMTLYGARSTWDSNRQLWVFRLGPKLCAFSPTTRGFRALPDAYTLAKGKKDRRGGMKGVTYIQKHDVYLISGSTAEDTWVYSPKTKDWSQVRATGPKLCNNGYLKYDAKTDQVVLSFQLETYLLRYVPEK